MFHLFRVQFLSVLFEVFVRSFHDHCLVWKHNFLLEVHLWVYTLVFSSWCWESEPHSQWLQERQASHVSYVIMATPIYSNKNIPWSPFPNETSLFSRRKPQWFGFFHHPPWAAGRKWEGSLKNFTVYEIKFAKTYRVILLMEEIRRSAPGKKPANIRKNYLQYQLVQDFFHQQYHDCYTFKS